jgi:hypothetical protein
LPAKRFEVRVQQGRRLDRTIARTIISAEHIIRREWRAQLAHRFCIEALRIDTERALHLELAIHDGEPLRIRSDEQIAMPPKMRIDAVGALEVLERAHADEAQHDVRFRRELRAHASGCPT